MKSLLSTLTLLLLTSIHLLAHSTTNSNLTINTSSINVTCNGSNDGAANVTSVQNAVPPLTYLWPSGGNTDTENNLSPGNYSVTVTDSVGCQGIANISITEPEQLSISLASPPDTLSCKTVTLNLDIIVIGGTPPYSYSPIVITQSGVYTITVTDNNGCTAQTSIEIVENLDIPTASASVQGIINCNGQNATLSAAGSSQGSNFTYTWYGPGNILVGNSQEVEVSEPGTYTLEVFSLDNCCFSASSVEVLDHFLDFDEDDIVIGLDCLGGVVVGEMNIMGSNSPFDVLWTINPDGQVVFTVTDAVGCSITSEPIIVPQVVIFEATADIQDESNTGNDGAIDLSVTGGTPPYTFQWDYNNLTTEDINNLPSGEYMVTITDANGCQFLSTFIVNLFTAIEDVNLSNQLHLFPNPSSGYLTLELENSISETVNIDVLDMTGKQILHYQNIAFQNKQYKMDLQNFAKGLYLVKIHIDNDIVTKKIILVD